MQSGAGVWGELGDNSIISRPGPMIVVMMMIPFAHLTRSISTALDKPRLLLVHLSTRIYFN